MRTSAIFYVTTTPGLEDVCRHELEGCQGVQCVQQVIPGGLTFTAPLALFLGVDQQPLQSICSLNAYIGTIEDISRTDDVDVVLERIHEYPKIPDDNWTLAYSLKHYHDINSGVNMINSLDESTGEVSGGEDMRQSWRMNKEQELCNPFRVSCTRKNSENHSAHQFTSLQAAGHLGWGIGKHYPKWTVDLKQPHVDIVFHIYDTSGVIAINLVSEKSICKRNRAPPLFDWITALSPPTAYSLCALLDRHIRPGMVICDPMCGIGTIPIEGALAYPECLFLGGELSDDSVAQARANVAWTRTQSFQACTDNEGNRKKHLHNVEIVQWNAGRIPLRDGSVDIIICDMPFGMKHGNYRQNRKLYPIFFSEVARILSENGKVLLLTLEMKLVRKTLASEECSEHLFEHSSLPVLVGGYRTKVFDIRKQGRQQLCS